MEGGVKPTLFIHKRCGRLIEMLPALQHDSKRPEDVLKVDADADESADALRYRVAPKEGAGGNATAVEGVYRQKKVNK